MLYVTLPKTSMQLVNIIYHIHVRYSIKDGDPTSAVVDIKHHHSLEWPDCEGGIKTIVSSG